jgi:ubiquinone/menaquinone biosynthesis C-methylase UbiE
VGTFCVPKPIDGTRGTKETAGFVPDNDADPMTKSLEEIAQAYDSPPWWYDVRGFFILTFAYRSSLGYQIRFFGSNMGARHLEVAIGSGSLTDIILRWRRWKGMPAPAMAGIDYALPMLAGAVRRFRNNPKVDLHHADVAALPFSDGEFDTANVANAVHCFPDVDAALKDIYRVLKPGGRLAVNVLLYPVAGPEFLRRLAERINAWGMKKGILTTPYTREDIRRRLEAAGFAIEEELVAGNTYNATARKPLA